MGEATKVNAWGLSSATKRVLVVDDDESISLVVSKFLTREQMSVRTARTGAAALEALAACAFDVILLDLRMPDVDGFGVLRALRAKGDMPAVLIHSAYLDVKIVTQAMRAGAADVVEKPCNLAELVDKIHHYAEQVKQQRARSPLAVNDAAQGPLSRLIGQSSAMNELRHQIECVAAFRLVSVLIDGPTGTGKELVARSIHELTTPDEPLMTINCAAIPENLLESELFGHAHGAFTSAKSTRIGLFEEARRGTVFLDEVGEMPHSLQTKLLRVLETREFRPVGSNQTKRLNARVVSATNRNLSPHEQSTLRQDLYFRLAGYTLRTPLLSARTEDIPVLARHFLSEFASSHQLALRDISKEALEALGAYAWPGNVRELKRCTENIAMVTRGERIERADVEATLNWRSAGDDGGVASSRLTYPGEFSNPESGVQRIIDHSSSKARTRSSLPELERAHILEVFETSGGNMSQAARTLGIARSTLRERLRKYRILGQSAG